LKILKYAAKCAGLCQSPALSLHMPFSFNRAMSLKMTMLLRHCEPDFPAHRCLGQFDAPLSSAGFEQALALVHQRAQDFSGVRHIYCSDLQRARQTAAPIAAALGLAVEIDARWRELAMGDFTNRDWDEIHQNSPLQMARWGERFCDEGAPGGESFLQLQSRVLAAFDAIPDRQNCLIVSHAGAIRALLASRLGLDAHAAMKIPVEYGQVMPI
jgi:2,3-bisphosphoglycerate-dependent phosphoglycerate mutase